MSQNNKGSRMILTLGLIATISGVLIVLSYQLTLPTILQNKARLVQQAALEVIPGAVSLQADSINNLHFFRGLDAQQNSVGLAVETQGQGFADVIRVIYGVSLDRKQMIGFKVLESKETPGLGDKIEKDTAFLQNFNALDLTHDLEVVKNGKKTHAWQIDGITGATISSKAVGSLLQRSIHKELTQIPVGGAHGK